MKIKLFYIHEELMRDDVMADVYVDLIALENFIINVMFIEET